MKAMRWESDGPLVAVQRRSCWAIVCAVRLSSCERRGRGPGGRGRVEWPPHPPVSGCVVTVATHE